MSKKYGGDKDGPSMDNFLKSVPRLLPSVVLMPPNGVIFPGLGLRLVFSKKEFSKYREWFENNNFFVLIPGGILTLDRKPVRLAVLCQKSEIEEDSSESVLRFTGKTRISYELVKTVNSLSWVNWQPILDTPVSKEAAETNEIRKELEVLKTLFQKYWQSLINKDVLQPQPLVKDILKKMAGLSTENLSQAMDAVMNLVMYEAKIDISFPALLILNESNVLTRLGLFRALLSSLVEGKVLATAAEDGTETSPTANRKSLPPHILELLERYHSIKNHMTEEARNEFEREFNRLVRKPALDSSLETRLEWIAFLPWEKRSSSPTDLRDVEQILNQDHAGLAKIKGRILEDVAVRMLNPRAKGKILCFVGPPGVGKTSLGQSIARALGKKFVRLSIGGLDDVGDLRGHHHTYLNAAPGFIMQLVRQCDERNCVFMLDELDKIQKNWRGDPASALLEILDPEQNCNFRDHYLGISFDLSEILFIATANIVATIPPTLRNRLEIIELPGYIPSEKLEIAQHFLIPKRRIENGFPVTVPNMPAIDVTFTDGAILRLINNYTHEAGVRELQRMLDMPFRRMAKAVTSQDLNVTGPIKISESNLHEYCGPQKFSDSELPDILPVGVVPVLATSDAGGFLFMAEVTYGRHPGRRKIAMKGVRDSGEDKDTINKIAESLEKAFDALTSEGGLLFDQLKSIEEEWGCPLILEGNLTDGAIPKDGPSAGLSLFLAVYGALTKKSIKPNANTPLTAATGEIEVNLDNVGKIGGLRDKILAAARCGVKRCFIPEPNKGDIEDIPEEVRREVGVVPVKSRWEALMMAYPEDREKIEIYLETRSS